MRQNETATQFLARLEQNCAVYETLRGTIPNANKFFLFECNLDQDEFLRACDNTRPTEEETSRDPWYWAETTATAYDRIYNQQKRIRTDNNNRPDQNGQIAIRRSAATDSPKSSPGATVGNGHGPHASPPEREASNGIERHTAESVSWWRIVVNFD